MEVQCDKERVRYSNIELCRIISIFCVLSVHSFWDLLFGDRKLPFEETIIMLFLESFAIIGVNVFVLITGYFSVIPKWKSLLNIAFICFFYLLIRLMVGCYSGTFFIKDILFISSSNWFVIEYIGLVLLAPVLNMFIEKVKRQTLKKLILVLFIYECWSGFLPGLGSSFNMGYSTFSFVILYLIARYLRLYGLPSIMVRNSLLIYFGCSVLIGILSVFFKGWGKWYFYNNPIVILSSVAFLIFFINLKLGYNKFVNHIAKSVFGVLLFHCGSNMYPFMEDYFYYIYHAYSGLSLIGVWILGILVIFSVAVIIDQVRIAVYNRIIIKFNKNGLSNSIV